MVVLQRGTSPNFSDYDKVSLEINKMWLLSPKSKYIITFINLKIEKVLEFIKILEKHILVMAENQTFTKLIQGLFNSGQNLTMKLVFDKYQSMTKL